MIAPRLKFGGSVWMLLIAIASCKESPQPRLPDSVLVERLLPPLSQAPLSPGEGRLRVDGGRIWYRVVGSGTRPPVILLHGGPGVPSYAMKALEALSDVRAVVRYDQLGSGKSDALTDTAKMNIKHFVKELDSLRAYLGYDRVHLVGHAWGGLLALEYYRAHPEHVVSLTMASPLLDGPEWAAHTRELLTQLPELMQRSIAASEALHQYNAPDYQAAVVEFNNRFLWLHPVVADLDSTTQEVGQAVFTHMMGATEFANSGTLKDYSAVSFLKLVAVPTLVTVGEVDVANPALVRRFASMIPRAKFVVIRGAAHMTMWDNPSDMLAAVRQQLALADGADKAR